MWGNLCDVSGVNVGHATDTQGWTGCTVILFDNPVVMSGDVRGSAPGTRETDLLHPVNRNESVDALLLTGGSAFGLAAADGVMRYLEEQGRGVETRVARVPIVPAAVIFDLAVGDVKARPDAAMGYAAARTAFSGSFAQGNVGAGTGATVGKVLGPERAMKGGLGSASVTLPGGVIVAALAAINAVGDVRDPHTGRILAGPRLDDGRLGDSVALFAERAGEFHAGENTTLGVVVTNAKLSKAQLTKVAQMAHDGLARTIYPVHTQFDGDAVFAASTGEQGVTAVELVGVWAAHVMQEAILRGVQAAQSIPGYPGLADDGESR